jgi:hypothetical protein
MTWKKWFGHGSLLKISNISANIVEGILLFLSSLVHSELSLEFRLDVYTVNKIKYALPNVCGIIPVRNRAGSDYPLDNNYVVLYYFNPRVYYTKISLYLHNKNFLKYPTFHNL